MKSKFKILTDEYVVYIIPLEYVGIQIWNSQTCMSWFLIIPVF